MTELNERLAVTEMIVDCTRCELHQGCAGPVPFAGPTPARIAIVGDAPHDEDDAAGRLFQSAYGDLIRQHLQAIGFDPADVFLCNTVSCKPADKLKKEHVDACNVNKLAQLDLADPQWVLVLGATALNGFRPDLKISKARGNPFQPHGASYVCFPTYHPEAALQNALYDKELQIDLQTFKQMVDEGPEAWVYRVKDVCIECRDEAYWTDLDGIPWCEKHLPAAGREYLAMIAADVEAARERVRARREELGLSANADLERPLQNESAPEHLEVPLHSTNLERPLQGGDGLSDPAANAPGLSGSDDGDTQNNAAWAVMPKTGTNRYRVLVQFFTEAAANGLIDDELCAMTGLDYSNMGPRRRELIGGGWITDNGKRRASNSGLDVVVWELTDVAKARYAASDEQRLLAAFPGATVEDA